METAAILIEHMQEKHGVEICKELKTLQEKKLSLETPNTTTKVVPSPLTNLTPPPPVYTNPYHPAMSMLSPFSCLRNYKHPFLQDFNPLRHEKPQHGMLTNPSANDLKKRNKTDGIIFQYFIFIFITTVCNQS